MGWQAVEEDGVVEAPGAQKHVRCNINCKITCQSQAQLFLVVLVMALPLCGAMGSDDSGTLQPLKGAPSVAFAPPQSSESNPTPARSVGGRTMPLPRRRDGQGQQIKAFASLFTMQKHSKPPFLSESGTQGRQEPTQKLGSLGGSWDPASSPAVVEKVAREAEEEGEEEFTFPKPICGECETVVRGEWFMGFSKTFCSEACRSRMMERVEGGGEPGWEWYPEFFRVREANERRKRQQAAIQRAIVKQQDEKREQEREQEDVYGMRSSVSSVKIGMDILRTGSGDERRGAMARLVEGG